MKQITRLLYLAIIMGIAFSCTKSEDSTPAPETGGVTLGSKFLAVKSLVGSSCALSGCHVSPANSGGVNFESNASIAALASGIKARAVDQGTMPPTGALSAANKAIITDWINAGGKLTD